MILTSSGKVNGGVGTSPSTSTTISTTLPNPKFSLHCS